MTRLPAPYGDCIPDGKTDEYIYQNYTFSVEVALFRLLHTLHFILTYRAAIDRASSIWC